MLMPGSPLYWPTSPTTTVREAFFYNNTFTLDFVVQIFRDPLYVEGLVNAFLLASCSTIGIEPTKKDQAM